MKAIPRLSEDGASQLMKLLIERTNNTDGGGSVHIIEATHGTYATIDYLCKRLTNMVTADSQDTIALLIDTSVAAQRLAISNQLAHQVICALQIGQGGVHAETVNPGHGVETSLLVVDEAALNCAIEKTTEQVKNSVEKAISLSDLVVTVLSIPDHVPNHSAVARECRDKLQNILRGQFLVQQDLVVLHERLIVTTDYMETASFPRAIQRAIIGLENVTPVAEILKTINTSPKLQPSLEWVIERLDVDLVQGRFCRSTSIAIVTDQSQYLFVPNRYLSSARHRILSSFAANGVYMKTKQATDLNQIVLVTPFEWLREVYPTAAFLRNAVVREDIVKILQEAINETESWVDLQPHTPFELDEEDIRSLVYDHVLGSNQAGIVVILHNNILFFTSRMVEEIERDVLPTLMRRFVEEKAKSIVQYRKTEKMNNIPLNKQRKVKDKAETDLLHPETIVLPQDDLVYALLQRYTDLETYMGHDCDGSVHDRRMLITKFCEATFYANEESTVPRSCRTLIQDELFRLETECLARMHRVSVCKQGYDTTTFEATSCFSMACYMVQLMFGFIEHFESTVDPTDTSIKVELVSIERDFLQGCCADFARRITLCSLHLNGVEESLFVVQSRDENADIDHFCSPINLAVSSYPYIRLVCKSKTTNALQLLRTSLDASVGNSIAKMWTLLGGECYQSGFRPGDLKSFLAHIREECLSICGLPFKLLDKKTKKQILNKRRQKLIHELDKESDPSKVLDLSIMHLFQHTKNYVVFGKCLRGVILERLLQEKKISQDLSSALRDLAAAMDGSHVVDEERIKTLKDLALGRV